MYIMFCIQMQVYVVFIILQTIISITMMGMSGLQIFGPLLFLGILYLLCQYKHFKIANVLLGLTIILGVFADLYILSDQTSIKHVLVAQAGHRDVVKAK